MLEHSEEAQISHRTHPSHVEKSGIHSQGLNGPETSKKCLLFEGYTLVDIAQESGGSVGSKPGLPHVWPHLCAEPCQRVTAWCTPSWPTFSQMKYFYSFPSLTARILRYQPPPMATGAGDRVYMMITGKQLHSLS